MMRSKSAVFGVSICVLAFAVNASAKEPNLRRRITFGNDQGAFADALRPLARVIANEVANQIPTLSTSAGYTYEFNEEIGAFERSSRLFGPLFSERAVTTGKGRFNANVSYSWIEFDEYNGHDIGHLRNHFEVATVGDRKVGAGIGLPLRAFDPSAPANVGVSTQLDLNLDIEAQLFDFSFTYGILDDLDVNVDIPVLRTWVRSELTLLAPDPRFTEYGVAPENVGPFAARIIDRGSSLGIGDMRLRSKYLAVTDPVRIAGLLDLALPTGSPGNLQGTGDTRLGVLLIASQSYANVIEPHLQGGVEFNCDDVDRSQARYLVGVTGQLASFASLSVDFIGRSEFARPERVPASGRLFKTAEDENGVNRFLLEEDGKTPQRGRPIFLEFTRNDILDLAVGGRVSIMDRAVLFATVLVPLNEDGLRANFVPTIGVEATF